MFMRKKSNYGFEECFGFDCSLMKQVPFVWHRMETPLLLTHAGLDSYEAEIVPLLP